MSHRILIALLLLLTVAGMDAPLHPTRAQDPPRLVHFGPSWSPDGTHLAYAANPTGNYDVWVMEADGSNPRNLTAASPADDLYPQWSPDGQRIAFSSNRAGNDDIWLMGADGSNPRNLTADNPAYDGEWAWSPDGQFIVYRAEGVNDGAGVVRLVRVDDGSITDILSDPRYGVGGFAWSPADGRLAYTRFDSTTSRFEWCIWLPDAFASICPSWIPDASQPTPISLAWSSRAPMPLLTTVEHTTDGDIMSLWRYDPAAPTWQRWLTHTNRAILDATWSPDGQSLVVAIEREPSAVPTYTTDLWLLDATGQREAVNLTQGINGGNLSPVWSPDGQAIAFTGYASTDGSLFEANADIWRVEVGSRALTYLTG